MGLRSSMVLRFFDVAVSFVTTIESLSSATDLSSTVKVSGRTSLTWA